MESNGVPGATHPNIGPRMQGLEMSLQHHHYPQNPTTSQSQIAAAYIHREYEQHQHNHPAGQTQAYPFAPKPKIQTLTLSDDDEPGQTTTTENSADDGKKTTSSSNSPWQRMKWTDNMVRLLIMVVYYIGDEVSSEPNDPSGKKKGSSSVLQKKGKWKSVSMAMMERGFYVSPQQCEDKFNDLNKRYKRVNDILGKGIACKVVENQSLLDSMDHLTPKTKDEVKKLLNSKHLFFREMCAYHNSCGHGTGGSSSNQQLPEIEIDPSNQQPCQHTSSIHEEENNHEEDDDDDDVDDDDGDYDDDDIDDKSSNKRQRKGNIIALSPSVKSLGSELKIVLEDETKNVVEKRQWMKARLMQLEEQHMGYDCQAFELEKQRLKWLKYCNKKEREMERDKLTNERKKLENERMALLIRQKDLELIGHYHHQIQQSSSMTD